jgi:hypothetical protein
MAFLIFSLPQTRVLIDDLREVTQGGKSKLGGDSRTLLRVLCHRNDSEASHYVKKHFKIPSSAPPSSWSGKSGNASKVYNGWNNGWLCNPGIISCSYVLVIFVHYYLLAVGSREAYTSSYLHEHCIDWLFLPRKPVFCFLGESLGGFWCHFRLMGLLGQDWCLKNH